MQRTTGTKQATQAGSAQVQNVNSVIITVLYRMCNIVLSGIYCASIRLLMSMVNNVHPKSHPRLSSPLTPANAEMLGIPKRMYPCGPPRPCLP
jgi:hypothetical protein